MDEIHNKTFWLEYIALVRHIARHTTVHHTSFEIILSRVSIIKKQHGN